MLDLRYGISSIAVRQMLGGGGPGPVEPGETLITAPGPGQYVVPNYNTLTIEGFGAGAGGASDEYYQLLAAGRGKNGGDTTVTIGTLVLTARGGKGPTTLQVAQPVATASGGDVNQSGGKAQDGYDHSSAIGDGYYGRGGAAAPGGGFGGNAPSVGTGYQNKHGNNGTAPGGGGSGSVVTTGGPVANHYLEAGGGGGARFQKTFVKGDPGAPVPGDILPYGVGAGGDGGTGHGITKYNGPATTIYGGKGADGQLKFIVV